jgi:hypothetical protein
MTSHLQVYCLLLIKLCLILFVNPSMVSALSPFNFVTCQNQGRLQSTHCKARSKCSMKKIGEAVNRNTGVGDFVGSDRNALKLAYKQAQFQTFFWVTPSDLRE